MIPDYKGSGFSIDLLWKCIKCHYAGYERSPAQIVLDTLKERTDTAINAGRIFGLREALNVIEKIRKNINPYEKPDTFCDLLQSENKILELINKETHE